MSDTKINLLTNIINHTATKDDFLAVSPNPMEMWVFLSESNVVKLLNSFGLNPCHIGSYITVEEVTPGKQLGDTRYRLYYNDFVDGTINTITYKGQRNI